MSDIMFKNNDMTVKILQEKMSRIEVAMLIPEWPGQTHIFFWREILALRELGIKIHIISTRQPSKESICHKWSSQAINDTSYLVPMSAYDLLISLIEIGRLGPLRILNLIVSSLLNHNLPWRNRLRAIALLPVSGKLVNILKRAEINHLHCHSFANSALLAAYANKISGITYSLTLHGDLAVYGENHIFKVANASFVSAVTRQLQKSLMSQLNLNDHIAPVIWMGVDTEKFCANEKKNDNPIFHIITVARLNPGKGHEYAIEAMKILVERGLNVVYTIVGAGDHKDTITSIITRMGLSKQIRLTGAIDEDRVAEMLRSSDAFCLPSVGLGEAAPVAVMEAMSTGLVVVATNIGGVPDMINDGVDGYIVPQKDPVSIADRLERIAKDKELRQRLGQSARQRALIEFDYRIQARKFACKLFEAVN